MKNPKPIEIEAKAIKRDHWEKIFGHHKTQLDKIKTKEVAKQKHRQHTKHEQTKFIKTELPKFLHQNENLDSSTFFSKSKKQKL